MPWGDQGSNRRWRELRRKVLDRDHGRCRLKVQGCTGEATHVHHVRGADPRALGVEDIDDLVASCASCNLKVGDPTRHDPEPRPLENW